MENITSEHLSNEDNHTTCECGNKTVFPYVWEDDNGSKSCPSCMVSWQSDQIKSMKELLYSKGATKEEVNEKYAEMMGVEVEDLDGADFS